MENQQLIFGCKDDVLSNTFTNGKMQLKIISLTRLPMLDSNRQILKYSNVSEIETVFCGLERWWKIMAKPKNTVFGLWDRIEDAIYSQGRTKTDVAEQCGFERKTL